MSPAVSIVASTAMASVALKCTHSTHVQCPAAGLASRSGEPIILFYCYGYCIEYVYVWLCLRVGVGTSEQHVIVLASDLFKTVFFQPRLPSLS